jgi:precorrin-8X/cobalt-precorrin-8 methylmutase
MAEAKKQGITRAICSIRKAVKTGASIYAIGNAPTALFELIRLIKAGEAQPALIIGVPVGFVSAVESKDALLDIQTPYITSLGRKGGTPVAVAIVNALFKMALSS